MNKDIRLATSFKGHRKRKRLKRILGFGAEVYLIDLWLTVSMDCPEGVLIGWDDEDIADSCGWEGDPNDLVMALIESGWLEKNSDGELTLHDWCEHQGWACKAKVRSEAAKKAAEARWEKKNGVKKDADAMRAHCHSNADAMRAHCHSHAGAMRNDGGGNAPSPSPSPSPSPKDITPCQCNNNIYTNTRAGGRGGSVAIPYEFRVPQTNQEEIGADMAESMQEDENECPVVNINMDEFNDIMWGGVNGE